MDLVDKVRQLILLAHQENLDEARAAALAAVRLISKHGLIIIEPAPNLGSSFPEPPRMRPIRTNAPSRSTDAGATFKILKSKYDGVCKWCRGPIRKNTRIYWSATMGAYHLDCFKKSEG